MVHSRLKVLILTSFDKQEKKKSKLSIKATGLAHSHCVFELSSRKEASLVATASN